MSLTLDVISSAQKIQESSCSFNEKGGTIGRKFSNTWVLPDESRHLSGKHAEIVYQQGQYFIIDTSTNGVFIDGHNKALGRGERAILGDGMRFTMGNYEIGVSVQDTSIVTDEVDTLTEDIISTDSIDELLLDTDDGKPDIASISPDPFFKDKDFIPDDADNHKIASSLDSGTKERLPEWDEPYVPPDMITPAHDDKQKQNMTSSVTKKNTIPQTNHQAEAPSTPKEPIIPELYDLENIVEPAEDTIDDFLSGLSISDSDEEVEAPVEAISTLEELGGSETSLPDSGISDAVSQNIPKEEKDPFEEFFKDSDVTTEALAVSTDGDTELKEKTSVPDTNDQALKIESDNCTQEILAEEVSEDSIPNNQGNTLASVQPENSMESLASVQAFLTGAGINNDNFTEHMSAEKMEMAGRLFRVAIEGTMDVIRSRAEIKNEMRMDVTTIQPIQNNPIKFSIDVDDALSSIFIPQKRSYMPPEQAFNEAYDDIKAHQVAIIAGIQASLKHVLKRFEPQKLIERLEEESPIMSKVPFQRESKLWDKFEQLHEDIEQEAEDDFNRLFGNEFSKAYEAQIDILKQQRQR